jgi:hypothetical protein
MAVDLKTGQPIFGGATSVGLRSVGNYQVAGHPFITGSKLATDTEIKIEFPTVAKSVTVIASGSESNIRVHFNSISDTSARVIAGNHYISLDNDEDSLSLGVKCREIYISSINGGGDKGFQLMASLTGIPTSSMYALTGSGLTD